MADHPFGRLADMRLWFVNFPLFNKSGDNM